MEKQKLRSEIDEQYKWDLTTIYKDDEEFEKALNSLNNNIESMKKYENIMMNSGKNLYNCLKLESDLDLVLNKLYLYAHLHEDEDTTNFTYQKYSGMVINLSCKYEKITSFIVPALMKYEYKDIEKLIIEYPKLRDFEINLKRIYREKKYSLEEKEEKLLSSISKALDNSSEVYSMLTDSDFTFGTIKDENGKEVELTDSNYSKYVSSNDRNVRKQAFDEMYKTYENHKNALAKTLSNTIDSRVALAKLRKYESCIYEALYSDDINLSIYDNLINTVSNNLNPLFKYYNLKKRLLNLDELHMYDIYTPVITESRKEYTFDEAKQMVLDSLKPLGEEYIELLNKAFDERWIDIYNNKGKRGGAYSSGTYGTNPFLLLNFEGKLNDVSTLAHELGHSMHTYYSNKNTSYQDSGYSIFVAEVASTVNELLLSNYILKNSKDKTEKINVLNNLLELYKSTLFRQTMFAEFEKEIYAKNEKGEILTSELLCNLYYDINKKYFGDTVVLDEQIKYEWERVPHFYYFFYVFKYATGISAATEIVKGILENKKNAKENYLKFLTFGNTMFPIDELKVAGVNMEDKKVIEDTINYFSKIVDEFEELNK